MSDAPEENTPRDDGPVLRAAEEVIAARFGGSPQLSIVDVLREKYRNLVLRCAVDHASASAPGTVIIKTVAGEGEDTYDPTRDKYEGTAWRFYNEWAGNRFLDSLPTPLSAGLIGGDRATGLIVLRDLGKEGKSLADCLTGTDRAEAESALLCYAGSMGRMHAETIGKEADFMEIRQEIGGTESRREEEGIRWYRESVEPFHALCTAVELVPPDALDGELEAIGNIVNGPTPFHAFSPGDTCPDNHRLTDTPYVRFFDFEGCGFFHALLTAAYFYLPFPTCWCVNRLPDEMVAQMEAAYRRELATACADAADDQIFYPALLACCAFWTVSTLNWNWELSLKKDATWGISSIRQRHLLRLNNFIDLAERHSGYPALCETARLLAAALRERYALEQEMPLYPPFREMSSS